MEIESLEKYERRAALCILNEFDNIFAVECDFVEVCEWKDREGYDIYINDDRHYSLSIGELEAINYLVGQLNKN